MEIQYVLKWIVFGPSINHGDAEKDKLLNENKFSRFYEEDQWENGKQGLTRNRPSKRSLPRSANQVCSKREKIYYYEIFSILKIESECTFYNTRYRF